MDNAWQTDKGRSQKLTMSTLGSGELNKIYKNSCIKYISTVEVNLRIALHVYKLWKRTKISQLDEWLEWNHGNQDGIAPPHTTLHHTTPASNVLSTV